MSPAESSAPSEEKRETKSSKELRDAGKQGVQSRRRSAAKEEKERIAEEKRRSFEEKKVCACFRWIINDLSATRTLLFFIYLS